MTGTSLLLAVAPLLPVLLAAACVSARLRVRLPALLVLAPLPGLAAALLATDAPPLIFSAGLVPFVLSLDRSGALLLGASALLWIAAGVYAAIERRDSPRGVRFAVCWLLTLSGSMGVFLAADLASFFLAYALVSIPAWGLVADADTVRARHAGAVYMAFTVLGETVLLSGFALLAAATPGAGLLIRDAVAALPDSPWATTTLGLLIAGFGIKIGLIPFHVWMPLAYRAAPIPAAAVLSGACVKAGVIGLIRFLPLGVALPDWGEALAGLGFLGAFAGVALGITQAHPKTILAYSSISQMGLIAAVLGTGLAHGDGGTGFATAFYAANHVLTKGALFLAVGVASAAAPRRAWPVLLPAAVLALGLGGLPLSGGYLAKLAIKAPIGSGPVAILAALSAAGSTLLMLHLLCRLWFGVVPETRPVRSPALAWCWLAAAAVALAVPWMLYPLVADSGWADTLSWASLWAAAWPVLLGVAVFLLLVRIEDRLPRLPSGDLLAVGVGALRAASGWTQAFQRLDARLRQWSIASLLLVAGTIVLGAAMLIVR